MEKGKEIGVRIDQTLTQDATGTMAYLQFELMGLKKVKCDLAVSYVDHNTIQVGPENADDHAYLRSVAAKYGIVFSKPGNGICHQLHLERFGAPGKTLLGADSHTTTGGGLGMLAIGAGGLDVAAAMAGGPFHLTMPKITKIALKGKLRPWVSAKDVVLKVLELLSTKGNVGRVLEYSGPGLKDLEVPERATIANMGAECGVTTSVFPSDEVTKKFLEAQGRADVWQELTADADAEYDKELEIDLAQLEPLAATPHSPGNISAVAMLAGKKVGQVLIGSCTNSSYCDLKRVAKILDGQKVHENVDLGIAPGSRQVLGMLAKEGVLTTLISAGARILESACGFCIGNSLSPMTDGVSLRTSNRNFEGRSGTPSAGLYLVSPEIAAVSAIQGRIVDPSLVDEPKYPRVNMPKSFDVDDSMFIFPPKRTEAAEIEIARGPNIGTVPETGKLPAALDGVVAIKVGDKITTDHIMPAGQRLKYRSNVAEYSKFVFEGTDPEFVARAVAGRDADKANFIVAGESYGQGSSREHAALCPRFLGVRVVVAKSIERIHLANLINFGIVPFLFVQPADYDKVQQGDDLSIAGIKKAVEGDGKAVLKVKRGEQTFDVALKTKLSDREKGILVAGGLLNAARRKK